MLTKAYLFFSTESPNNQQIAQENSKRKQHKEHKEVNSSNRNLFNTENRFQALSDVLVNQTQTETMTKNHQKDNEGKITNEQNECTAQIQNRQQTPNIKIDITTKLVRTSLLLVIH